MKRTEISKIPIVLPSKIEKLCKNAEVFDSSCSPEARVYFIDAQGGYYLKSAAAGSLKNEALMTDYFHKKGLAAEVVDYISGEGDLLLTRALSGEDCTHYLDDPKRLCDVFGEKLRQLHEIDYSDCPIKDLTLDYLDSAFKNYENGSYNKDHFPDSFGYRSADEAFKILSEGKDLMKSDALIHGDYCLPNVMLDNLSFSGFIDLGQSGVGNRHIDLFWGRWSLEFNLKTDKYSERFFDAYGHNIIETELLEIVAAAEVFH